MKTDKTKIVPIPTRPGGILGMVPTAPLDLRDKTLCSRMERLGLAASGGHHVRPSAPKPVAHHHGSRGSHAVAAPRVVAGKSGALPRNLHGLTRHKSLGGSTGAWLYQDDKSGQKYVVKGGAHTAQCISEFNANQIYRICGVRVAKCRLVDTEKGKRLISEFIRGQPLSTLRSKGHDSTAVRHAIDRLKAHFVVDALLGAWDAIGVKGNNIMVDERGRAWRIDNGCAFQWRARGENKKTAWGDEVYELVSLRQSSVNKDAAAVYSSLTDKEIRVQVRSLLARRVEILAAVPSELQPRLQARLAYMKHHWSDETPGLPKRGGSRPSA